MGVITTKYKTVSWDQTSPGLVERTQEVNATTVFFEFRNTGNSTVIINGRRLGLGEVFDTRVPFPAIDDTSYKVVFSKDGNSNCAAANIAQVSITRYDLIS